MFAVFCVAVAKPGDSLLTATKFPKSTDDLTFRQRMDVLTAGYEDFDTVFDSNGVCIKNCPYVGITIKDFEKRIQDTAAEVQQDLNEINSNTNNTQNTVTVPPINNNTPTPPVTPPVNPPNPPVVPPSVSNIPTTCPLRVNPVRVTSEWKWREKYKRYHHGVDIGVSVGTPVYAAADGRVVIRKNDSDGYGNYLSIRHDKNYYTVYGHLSKWLVSNGQTVRAGQKIGLSGNTGNSTGPHLHFEVLKNAPLARQGADSVNPRTITQCSWSPENNSINANPDPH